MALREIFLELGIEVDGEDAEKAVKNIKKGLDNMARGDSVKKAEKNVNGLIGKMTSLKKLALGAGAAFLTGKLAQGMFALVEAASDSEETYNKLGAVFVERTDDMVASSDELANRIGQSKSKIQGMNADVGALVKPLLGSTDAAAKMAKQVTELAFDISSFENVEPDDALIALRSALIGSSEPMLRFGVDTRVAALNQFALEKGLNKTTKEMTAAELTTLRLELVMARMGTKGAVGDATKTADGFANRLRALKGAFTDLKGTLGKQVLPMATDLLGLLIKLVRSGDSLVAVIKAVGRVMRGLFSVFANMFSETNRLYGIVGLLSISLGGLAIALNVVGVSGLVAGAKIAAGWIMAALPVIVMIALMGIIIATIALLIEDFVAMGEGAESFTGTLIQGFNDLVEEMGSIPAAIEDMLKHALKFWLGFFGMAGDAAKDFTDNLFTMFGEIFDDFKKIGEFFGIGGGEAPTSKKIVRDPALTPPKKIKAPVSSRPTTLGTQPMSSFQEGAGILSSQPTTSSMGMGSSVSNQSMSNSQTNNISIEVDAANSSNPEDVANAVSRGVQSVLDQQNREAQLAFQEG